MRVQLGNAAPHEVLSHDDVKARGLNVKDYDRFDEGKMIVPADVEDAVTTVDVSPESDLITAFGEIVHLWRSHSSQPPAWVASDNDTMAGLLAEQYGCPVHDLVDDESVGGG